MTDRVRSRIDGYHADDRAARRGHRTHRMPAISSWPKMAGCPAIKGSGDPVIYAGAHHDSCRACFDEISERRFSLNRCFDTAMRGEGRLFGSPMHGHWLTVGTPEAIAEAEAAMRRLSRRNDHVNRSSPIARSSHIRSRPGRISSPRSAGQIINGGLIRWPCLSSRRIRCHWQAPSVFVPTRQSRPRASLRAHRSHRQGIGDPAVDPSSGRNR
jgi:hypothetical protein